MSKQSIQGWLPGDKRPYTYALTYADGRVFYYGKGTGRRIFQHRSETMRKKPDGSFSVDLQKHRVIRKIWASGKDYQEIILAYHSTEQEAFMHEIALIFLSGDKLTNLTVGGEGTRGAVRSLEARRRQSEAAKNCSEETRRKRKEASTGKTHSIATRLKIGDMKRGQHHKQPHSEEHRRKIGLSHINRVHQSPSEQTRLKMSKAHEGMESPRKGIKVSEKTLLRMSESQKARREAERKASNVQGS